MAKTQKAEKKHSHVIILIIAIFIVLLLPLAQNMYTALHEEKIALLSQTMNSIENNINMVIHNHWEITSFYARNINNKKFTNTKALFEELSQINKAIDSESIILLIDQDGNSYLDDGTSFAWAEPQTIQKVDKEVWVSIIPVLSTDQRKTSFVIKLNNPIVTEDHSFTHIAMVEDMEIFESHISATDYEDCSATYIIRPNGQQIALKNSISNLLSNQINIISNLDDAQFKSDITSGKSNVIHTVLNGLDCFVCYQYLGVNDWYAMLIVPANQVQSKTQSVMLSIIRISIMFTVLLCLAITIAITRTNQYKKVSQRDVITLHQEINELTNTVESERSASEAKTKFINSMSHNIRTPLNAINGVLNLTETHIDDPEYLKTSFKKIRIASNHLLSLVKYPLDVSSIESGTYKIPAGKMSNEEIEHETLPNLDYQDILESKKIIIAEDDDINFEIANEILGMYGIKSTRATNGQECVELVSKAQPGDYDFILMDIEMPILNGLYASKAIRRLSNKELKNIPIIAMTANAFDQDAKDCFDAGMNAHIPKPFELRRLVEALYSLEGQHYATTK
ncbi:MAG: response regulator [Sphaerochaetaceae bacterium]|nr:response regulator [Sphaerochaetaceae bacterium]